MQGRSTKEWLYLKKKYTLKDLYISMMAKAEQLSEIYNEYMILLFDDTESAIGKLVFCGDVQNQEYDSWVMQPKTIIPIYNDKEELKDMAVYDE
ncbi:MAG: hypothetical protein K2J60_08260 [Acetatifactor sp.]|nr:hypothetical protein [Acetatifactor sp.]